MCLNRLSRSAKPEKLSMNRLSQAITRSSITEGFVNQPRPTTDVEVSQGEPLPRPAWIEIDLQRFRRNYQLINRDKPHALQVLAVVKDEAYGHGALALARIALESGAAFLGLSTLEEAVAL